MTFPAEIAAARSALALAERQTAPIAPELAAQLEAWSPEKYAECLAKIAAIEVTIPGLRAAYDALAGRVCWKCQGSGNYDAPTSHLTRGRAVCWTCGGSRERRTR